jgi:hypothetical protein
MTTNHLPLRWTRLIVLSLLTVMSITASALCVQMFEKYDILLIRFTTENNLILTLLLQTHQS